MLLSLMLAYVTVGPLSALVLRNMMAVISHARLRHAAKNANIFLDQLYTPTLHPERLSLHTVTRGLPQDGVGSVTAPAVAGIVRCSAGDVRTESRVQHC